MNKKMQCGNCFFWGVVTHFCHCGNNPQVKKRMRHKNSPKCREFKVIEEAESR